MYVYVGMAGIGHETGKRTMKGESLKERSGRGDRNEQNAYI